jgi:hypothetical protein
MLLRAEKKRKKMRTLIKVTLVAALAALTAQGAVVPYSSDANTLHLYHADDATTPLADSAGSLPLYDWGSRGTFGVDSVAGLNKAWESSTTVNSDLQSIGNISWGAGSMMGTDGAFTWEMVLRPDEAANSGAGVQMLMLHNGNQMQLKLDYNGSGDVYLTVWDGVNSATLFYLQLDTATLGGNEYAANEWFHLGVTYDGASAGKVYWTKLGAGYTGTANELGSFSMSDMVPADHELGIGGTPNLGGSVFNGAIDEIRISDIARDSNEFMAIPEPGTLGLVISAGIVILGIRRHFMM